MRACCSCTLLPAATRVTQALVMALLSTRESQRALEQELAAALTLALAAAGGADDFRQAQRVTSHVIHEYTELCSCVTVSVCFDSNAMHFF